MGGLRGICRSNDEFLWGINLSNDATGSGQKYRIFGYDKEYAKSLNDDSKFDIVTRVIIPVGRMVVRPRQLSWWLLLVKMGEKC